MARGGRRDADNDKNIIQSSELAAENTSIKRVTIVPSGISRDINLGANSLEHRGGKEIIRAGTIILLQKIHNINNCVCSRFA